MISEHSPALASRDGREAACGVRKWGVLPACGKEALGAEDTIRGLEKKEEDVVIVACRAICQHV